MTTFDNAVSIRPYFKIHEGQLEACKSFLSQFNAKVANEEGCLYYNFTLDGDLLSCREAYHDASRVEAHIENCGELLGEFLKIVDLTRIEVHGPAEELERLKPTFAEMNPDFFTCAGGIGR